MKAKAEALGWSRLYESNEDFRLVFDQMCAAIETLPAEMIDRGRLLPFPQLHVACVEGELDLVEALLGAGVAPDTYPCTEDDDDEPPLVWLAKEGMDPDIKIRVAELLIARGADVDEGGALGMAQEIGDDDFARFLRKFGAMET